MTTAGTAGELGGRIAGGWIGGVIGSFIPPPGLGTLIGRAVGSRLGGMAGRAAAATLQDHISSMEDAEEEAEKTDGAEGTAADSKTCDTCGEPPRPPNRRHDPCRTRGGDQTKAQNTMWDPDYELMVRGEVDAIQTGKVPKVNGTWTINGRTYGMHGKSLHPISGPGFTNLSRMQHQVVKMLNSKGYEGGAEFAKNLMERGLLSQDELDEVLHIWRKCNMGGRV